MSTVAANTESAPGARGGSPLAPPRWLAICAVLLAALIWSSSFAITKVVLDDLPPMTIGALRFSIATVVLGVIVHSRRDPVLPTRRQKGRLAVAGLLGITAYFALENVGVDLASASDATLIVASYPVITLTLEFLLGRGRLTLVHLVGMLLAIVGVGVVVSNAPGSSSGGHHLIGDLILLAGGIAWAAYNLISQRDSSGASALVATYYQTMAGAVGFVPLALGEAGQWTAPSTGALARITYLALFCSVAAFLAYNFGLRGLNSSTAVNLLNIVPVTGLVWAVTLAGETLVPIQVLGGAIVIVGVALGLTRTSSERAGAAQPTPSEGETSCPTTSRSAPSSSPTTSPTVSRSMPPASSR